MESLFVFWLIKKWSGKHWQRSCEVVLELFKCLQSSNFIQKVYSGNECQQLQKKKQKTHTSCAKLSRISKKSELPNGWVDVVTNILLWPPDEDSNRTEMGTVSHTLDVALPPSFPNGVFPETTLQCSNWVFRACGLGRGTCGVGEGGVGGRRKDVSWKLPAGSLPALFRVSHLVIIGRLTYIQFYRFYF